MSGIKPIPQISKSYFTIYELSRKDMNVFPEKVDTIALLGADCIAMSQEKFNRKE